ncbi:MAG: eukaryotic-like serine/threonine-protein kinase [Blastocatellia bacterium]|jgi:serine/threonine-protein kinase|nr:eukaryotic-like serine/threonine-protein kinase [Blastocatellia bacterium]
MVGQTLGNYKITQKIGAGGQGAVYKATDNKLGRTVVVKVLPAELTVKETNLKRFEREARLASTLDHPNICTIFDLDQANGLHFITMQYVEGRNVRQLVGGRPLELNSALRIAIQTADALAAAHARGIIHRDIKSGNVMVTDSGQVKILDFGLAKLLDENEAAAKQIHQTELTEVGVPYGTATYAAPEQARGDRVDARADIFSTGVLLYEMLTGTWPFRGKSSVDVRHAVIHDAPKPVAEIRKEPIPPRLQQILDRSMAKEPRDRYQKITELRDELRSVLHEISTPGEAAESVMPAPPRHVAGANPVSRAMRWLRTKTSAPSHTSAPGVSQTPAGRLHETPFTTVADREKKSIAILPFKNLNNDPASSFYEFSLADAVITELARIRSLVVRPSSVIAKYQGQNVDPRDVGRELNVTAVLATGFLRVGERFRVTAQLLDVATGDMLWSDRIDAAAADIIAVQDTIAQRIVDGLRLELSPDEQAALAQPTTVNAAAYEEYLRGRDLFSRFIFRSVASEDCDAAISHFNRAIELDPEFALAYDGLGASYVNRVHKGLGGAEDYERAEIAFNKALELDPDLIEARMLMVFVYLWRGEKQKARDEVSQMRRQAPNEAVVHFVKATLHRLDGEYDRALRSYDKLVRLDPAAHVVVSYNRALIFIFKGQPDEAMRELDQATAIEPNNPLLKTFRALTLYYQGETDQATAILRDVVQRNPTMHGVRPFLAMCLSAQGHHDQARAEITDAVKRNAEVDADIAYSVGSVYALENEPDTAFEWLQRSVSLGNQNRPCFEHDPNLASLREDSRFKELIVRITR